MSPSPTTMPYNFESDLGHCLDTKNITKYPNLLIYLLLHALAEVFNLQVLFNLYLLKFI